jgi:fibronectin type 3 domain-containing protein/ribosomal protein L40E
MANENSNLYEVLEGYLNTGQKSLDEVLNAIKACRRKLQDDKNPRHKAENNLKLENLKKIEAQVKASPDLINQHAAAYAEIAQQKRIEREKEVREKGNLYIRDGMIAQQNLTQLVNETKLSEEEVLKILGVKVRKKKTFTYQDDGVTPLEEQKMDLIASNLKVLEKKDLYEFLEVKPNATLSQIEESAKAKFSAVTTNMHKTDPRVNATDVLVKQCTTIFANEEGRKRYNKAIEERGFKEVGKAIARMKGSTSFISAAQYRQFLETCSQGGIPRDKAEYLIYTSAEKAGLEVDEGTVNELTTCRYCGALNERGTQSCRSCGMPVKVPCPKCGKESSEADYRCTKCGFSLIGMKDAHVFLVMARAALEANNPDDAEKQVQKANNYWPGNSEAGALMKEIGLKRVSQKGMLEKIGALCAKKLYYTAQQSVMELPVGNVLRKETIGAVETAEELLRKADATVDANMKLDIYMQALEICADCKKAADKIKQTPPQAPTSLTATVMGANIRLSWQKAASNHIAYQIVRKENAQPSSLSDGENLGITSNSSFDDDKATAGISYFYAVYSKCAEYVSTKAALLSSPVMRVEEIDPKIIRVNPQETSLEFLFDFPRGLFAIEIYREEKLVKTLTGTSYIDSGLATRKTYNYKFVGVYHDTLGNSHKSKGVVLQYTPMPKPQPVDLKFQDGEKQAVLKWNTPSVGNLCIYYSDSPFKYNKNDVISIDTFKAERLNVTGNSCTINKDFNSERFFIPVTVQGNMGVVGNTISIISLSTLSGTSIERDENKIEVRWKWEGTYSIRICYSIDDGNERVTDVFKEKTNSPLYIVQVPAAAKSVAVKIMPLVRTSSKELLGKAIEKVFSMKASKVSFENVINKKKLGFLSTDEYVISFISDTHLPCDLHLLVQEQFPPIDLVHYTPVVVIKKANVKPNVLHEVSFTFKRRMKGQSVHFRLIAADRKLSKQIIVTPETRQIK